MSLVPGTPHKIFIQELVLVRHVDEPVADLTALLGRALADNGVPDAVATAAAIVEQLDGADER